MTSDSELLRRYCEDAADSAIAELVQRYLGLVYSAALRQVGGNSHLAEEIAQIVFLLLVRKAAVLRRHPVLIGWLHTTTRLTALQMIKEERRRKQQEGEFTTMETISTEHSSPAQWERLRPVIDEVIAELADTDRQAILLRFFSERTFGEIGATLYLTEEAARKRVQRALDKLHTALARRGIASTSAALSVVLAGQVASAAPAGLAVAITGAALTGVGVTVGASSAGIGLITTFMSTIKAQVGMAALIVAAGATGLVFQSRASTSLQNEIETVRRDIQSIDELRQQNRMLITSAAEARRLRDEDAELGQLRDEVETVKARQQEAGRLEAAARQARNAKFATQPIYSEKELDQKPQTLRQGAPVYPNELQAKGITGTVLLSYVVTASGDVADLQIVKATDPAFGRAAAEAVEKWQFAPGMKNGQQVNVRTQLPITFSISDPNKPLSPEQTQRRLAQRWF